MAVLRYPAPAIVYQVVALEDKAQLFVAESGQLFIVEIAGALVVNIDTAFGWAHPAGP
jgi:hypothetical protein